MGIIFQHKKHGSRYHKFMKIFDAHAHLCDDELFVQIDEVLDRAQSEGVGKIVNVCTDQKTVARGLELQKQYPGRVYNAAAIAPHYCHEMTDEDIQAIIAALQSKNVVAIGETGLDYFYGREHRDKQLMFLEKHLEISTQQRLPIFFHVRGEKTFSDLFSVVKHHTEPMMVHCFTGTMQEAKKALDLGMVLSFSGIVTFKKSQDLHGVIRYVPLDRIVVETDAPYLAPTPYRGKTNEPAFIIETIKLMAELKMISLDQAATIFWENSCKFFSIYD